MKSNKLFSHWSSLARAAAVLTPAIFFLNCATEAPLVPTSLALLQISANPTAIPVVDGVSTVTVVGQELTANGEVVLLEGAEILFTTNVGKIDARVLMRNGVATAHLRSSGRAGLASVTATAAQGGIATLAHPVLVGNAAGLNIVLTANPATVVSPDFTSELLATAFDNDNNPMRDVPIIFDASAGATASQGSILRTNVLGQALDRFELRDAQSATVTARSGAIASNIVTISRNALTALLRTSNQTGA